MIAGYKDKLIEMLKYFESVCEANNLSYYAIGGTFLGALRHQGFIPWDNDIDVAMPRRDYDRLAEIVNHDHSIYTIETPRSPAEDYLYSVSKLYDTATTLIENLRYECKRGVYIDIFPLDGIGDTEDEVKKNYKKINLLNNLFAARTCAVRPQRKWWKNLAIRVINILPEKVLNPKHLLIKLDNLCRRYDFDSCKYVGVLLTQYGLKYVMPRELFNHTKRYQFESTTVVGVEDYDTYLTMLFGDWRKLPPKEKQVEGHDYKYIDLEQSYLEGSS